jgi:YHS domain-containing protein
MRSSLPTCGDDPPKELQVAQSRIKNMNSKSKSIITLLAALVLTSTFALADSALPKNYPLKKCVVSGDPLGEHGKVVKVSSEGTDVYLCCKDCVKDFKKDPAKYTKMVKDAQGKK